MNKISLHSLMWTSKVGDKGKLLFLNISSDKRVQILHTVSIWCNGFDLFGIT